MDDPVPPVGRGDLVVGIRTVAGLPRLPDAPDAAYANNAHARIQNLVPGRDGAGDFFVNDLRGVIYRVHRTADGTATVSPYFDVRSLGVHFTNEAHGNESGLSGFAFHPDFNAKGKPGYGRLYVAFSTPSGSGTCDFVGDGNDSHESVVAEWTTTDPTAATFTGTVREVLRVGQPGPTHNIGTIAFNPTVAPGDADYGQLYISFGDGKGQHDPLRAGQRRGVPLGKILRLDPLPDAQHPRHRAPADNPFVGEPEAAPLVWAYGLRHPQHFGWDIGGTRRMFIAEMGQDQIDEIDIGTRGGNYGWADREATFATGMALNARPGPVYERPPTDPTPMLYPVAQYDHDDGKAVGSVVVYRGKSIPALQGKLLCGDLMNGRIFYADEAELQQGRQTPLKELRLMVDGVEKGLSDVTTHGDPRGDRVDLRLGVDADGEVYLLTKGDGKIRQLVPAASAK
ncbi:MAG TPA: PQQ-dependent sugar dehydrogenase [Tepidisphaeraceae bacterium]